MTVTMLQLSDTHLTQRPGGPVSGVDPDRRLGLVLEAWTALGERADLVVITGDAADDSSPAAYKRLAAAMIPLGAPILAVAGNHDSPRGVAMAFGEAGTAEAGAWRIVCIDSSRPGQIHGTVDVPGAVRRLDALDDRPTVVGIHHPPRSRSTHPWFGLEGAADLLAALAVRPHVRAVISGHLHETFDFEGPGGLALLGCPSTLLAITHHGDTYVKDREGPTGARALRLHDDGTFDSTLVLA